MLFEYLNVHRPQCVLSGDEAQRPDTGTEDGDVRELFDCHN